MSRVLAGQTWKEISLKSSDGVIPMPTQPQQRSIEHRPVFEILVPSASFPLVADVGLNTNANARADAPRLPHQNAFNQPKGRFEADTNLLLKQKIQELERRLVIAERNINDTNAAILALNTFAWNDQNRVGELEDEKSGQKVVKKNQDVLLREVKKALVGKGLELEVEEGGQRRLTVRLQEIVVERLYEHA